MFIKKFTYFSAKKGILYVHGEGRGCYLSNTSFNLYQFVLKTKKSQDYNKNRNSLGNKTKVL